MFVLSIAFFRGIFCLSLWGGGLPSHQAPVVNPGDKEWLGPQTACVWCLGQLNSQTELMPLECNFISHLYGCLEIWINLVHNGEIHE